MLLIPSKYFFFLFYVFVTFTLQNLFKFLNLALLESGCCLVLWFNGLVQ